MKQITQLLFCIFLCQSSFLIAQTVHSIDIIDNFKSNEHQWFEFRKLGNQIKIDTLQGFLHIQTNQEEVRQYSIPITPDTKQDFSVSIHFKTGWKGKLGLVFWNHLGNNYTDFLITEDGKWRIRLEFDGKSVIGEPTWESSQAIFENRKSIQTLKIEKKPEGLSFYINQELVKHIPHNIAGYFYTKFGVLALENSEVQVDNFSFKGFNHH